MDCYVNSRGHSWDRGRVTAPPTETASGVRTWLCTRCGDNRTEAIGPWPNPFVDVTQERYYYTPVRWAADAGVTAGVDSTHFAPGSTCTRGQVVTFLWRAYGCPAPKSAQCPFGDVSPQRYYYQAVLWAAEQRITDGVDATHFAPDRTVTRGQLVTFLWRAEGCPTGVGTNPFADVGRDGSITMLFCGRQRRALPREWTPPTLGPTKAVPVGRWRPSSIGNLQNSSFPWKRKICTVLWGGVGKESQK